MNSQIDNIMFIVNRYALAVVFCFIIICFAMGSYVMGGGRPSIEESSREDGKNFLGAILGCRLPFALKIIFTGAPKGDPCIFYISIALIIIAIICNGAISGRIRTNGDTAFDRNNAKHFVPVKGRCPHIFFLPVSNSRASLQIHLRYGLQLQSIRTGFDYLFWKKLTNS